MKTSELIFISNLVPTTTFGKFTYGKPYLVEHSTYTYYYAWDDNGERFMFYGVGYFITLKEFRKLKLEKLNENG